MPSSFSGTYGMKPTWGLVPYTGVMPIESTIDHTGPITATVADNADRALVLAQAQRLGAFEVDREIDLAPFLARNVVGPHLAVLGEMVNHAQIPDRRAFGGAHGPFDRAAVTSRLRDLGVRSMRLLAVLMDRESRRGDPLGLTVGA